MNHFLPIGLNKFTMCLKLFGSTANFLLEKVSICIYPMSWNSNVWVWYGNILLEYSVYVSIKYTYCHRKILINFIFYLFEYKLFYWCIKIGYIAETNIRSNEIISMRHIFFVIRWKTSKYILRNGTNDIMCCQRGATCQMTIFFYTILD